MIGNPYINCPIIRKGSNSPCASISNPLCKWASVIVIKGSDCPIIRKGISYTPCIIKLPYGSIGLIGKGGYRAILGIIKCLNTSACLVSKSSERSITLIIDCIDVSGIGYRA